MLATACDALVRRGFGRPVLVGGGAVEFHTGGAVTSGDFDIVTEAQAEFETELRALGFEKPKGRGQLIRGLIHPDLEIAVEVVGRVLFDGAVPMGRVLVVEVEAGHEVGVLLVEDLIADRLGQAVSGPRRDPRMLDQAVKLYVLARQIDENYLDGRIRAETLGELDLKALKELIDASYDPGPTG